MSIGSPLVFVRGAASIKSIRIVRDVNQMRLAFCICHCVCKKYKRWLGTSIRETLADVYASVR
jgi:hypothetical protein